MPRRPQFKPKSPIIGARIKVPVGRELSMLNHCATSDHETPPHCAKTRMLARQFAVLVRLRDMTIPRMDNVAIVVDDLDAAVSYFTELGMEMAGRG